MNYHTKADYLHVISFDSFLFGLLLLIMGPVESAHYYNVDHIVLCMNLFMTLSQLHCLISDRMEIGIFKPCKLIHTFLFIVVLIISIYMIPEFDLSEYPHWRSLNIFYSLAMCFIGFIAYTFCAVLGCGCACIASSINISKMSLTHIAEEHAEELKRYSNVLEEIDAQLNVGSSDFQINGDSTQTLTNTENGIQ